MRLVDHLELLKKLVALITILMFAIAFTACKTDDDDDDDDDDSPTVNSTDTSIPSGVSCGTSETELEGTWESSCFSTSDGYKKFTIFVSGDCRVFLKKTYATDDTDCSGDAEIAFKQVHSGVSVGSATTDNASNSATELDEVWEYFLVTPLTDYQAASVNDNCGTTLNSGDSVDLLENTTCGSNSAGDDHLTMYQLSGSSLIWASDDSEDSNGRENELYLSVTYTEQ